MSLYQDSIPHLVKNLENLNAWLDKAVEHAKQKPFEADSLLHARLAPDQYALARQIQAACDAAKFVGARLTGKEAPAHPDTEKTMDELKARIGKCVAFLKSLKESDFKGAEDRIVPLTFMAGKGLLGRDYLFELGLPNFWFHATTAYAILRHNGVNLGKQDFIGSLTLQDI